ncbi:MAG: DUF2254 domain-containing protein [Acidimicrobiales bacterium]
MPSRVEGELGSSILRLDALKNRLTQSLFFVPFLMLSVSLALSQLTVQIDRQLAADALPGWFQVTVDSSRSILSAIAGGTITAASIVFSLTLVAVQLAASQFSPRVLRDFLGDRFQQLVMGTVIGTFSYSLLVLREVRSAPEGVERAFLPQVSVALAVVLAVVSLVAILGSIDHTAKGLRVGSVADGIVAATMRVIEQLPERGSDDTVVPLVDAPGVSSARPTPESGPADHSPPGDALVVWAPRTGWVTGIQVERLMGVIPDGVTVSLSAAVGTYVVRGTPIAFIWPRKIEAVDEIVDALPDVMRIEEERTMQQDISFGILQLNDIAMRALSPGVNDPNTANEIVVRLGAVITELYRRDLPPIETAAGRRRILRPSDPGRGDYVEQAFEPVRRYARQDPRVLEVIVGVLESIIEDCHRRQGDEADVRPLIRQLELMSDELGELATSEDRRRVGAALARVFAEVTKV